MTPSRAHPPGDGLYRFANIVGRLALRSLAVETRWIGVDNIPRTGPVILAATHASYPDFVFVEQAAVTRRRYVRFMCRHEIWDNRFLHWSMERMRHIPVDREAPAFAYLRARNLLRSGEAVCGFPEAGISYSYTVRPLMRGLASLARETGAPIVPVAIWGSQRIFSVGDPDPPPDHTRRRRVDLSFGEQIRVAQDGDVDVVTRDLGCRLTELLESLQALSHHQPRPGEYADWHPAHLGGHAPTRQRARDLDDVPRAALKPTWGPDVEAYDDL